MSAEQVRGDTAERTPRRGPGGPQPSITEELDLRDGLGGLSGLVAGSMSLEQLLERVARLAADVVPGADAVGVTLVDADGRVQAGAATAAFAAEVDAVQFARREGPCVAAVTGGRTVTHAVCERSPWPKFLGEARRCEVRSVLAVPLALPEAVVGAIGVYARARDAFDVRAVHLAERIAAPAAVAVHNAHLLAQARVLAARLQAALSSRAVIDQAIGILMSRTGATPDEAFASLRRSSQDRNVKLAQLAGEVVDQAVRRARQRHSST